MRIEPPIPPRHGERDRAKRGGGGSRPVQRQIVYRARKLGREMSLPGRLLWRELRQRPGGLKFRNQHSIGDRYMIDFCCLSRKLAVEIDGQVHDMGDIPARDVVRQKFLEENAFRVLRISARRILADVAGAAAAIVARAEVPHHRPTDGPPPRAGED